ncbi:MAG: right-handed parallel beta-helix repeat-containing protein [Methanothrix sp.]
MILVRLIILVLIILSLGVAQSATIGVGGTNASFSSIQRAIDAAEPGDNIEVYSGTYQENVFVYKALKIRGIFNGSSMPTIDAGGKGSAITLTVDGVLLEGLMMTNSLNGSGIEIASSNNTIIGNKASKNKFGIYAYNSRNNILINNDLGYNHHAGMELDDSVHNIISNNRIYSNFYVIPENSKNIGVGLIFYNSSYNEIRDNIIEDNTLDAISFYNSKVNIIKNNVLRHNAVGIYLLDSNESQIEGNQVINNTKTGIFIESSYGCMVTRNILKNNSITGLNLWKGQNNILRGNLISGSKWNFDADGHNDIDTSNLIDGRLIYYLVGKSNIILDENSRAGAVYCINCSHIIIKNLIFNNTDMGVLFDNTINSRIENNKFERNEGGIVLLRSNCNYIMNNKVNVSLDNGILIGYSSDKNTIIGNTVRNSLKSGLAVVESWNNIITNNTANNNRVHGISINNSGMNTLKWNNGSYNGNYGLFITTPNQDNYIENNRLSSNMKDNRVHLQSISTCSPFVSAEDFGDAPDSYHTLLATNGARHEIVDGVHLGLLIDAEPDGIPTPRADGDDKNNIADEDGVVFITNLSQGSAATVQVNASVAGKLNAWIDFNGDGDWADANEQIFKNEGLAAGLNALTFYVPSNAAAGSTYSRFRFNIMGGLSFEGRANDGEVEDYLIDISS